MAPHCLARLLLLAAMASACAGSSRLKPDDHTRKTSERFAILQMVGGICTEEICGPLQACCHSCGSSGVWTEIPDPHRIAHAAIGQLPDCAADGCGRCSFTLAAFGVTERDHFLVTRWTQLPGCAAQQCRGEGACDAVLAEGRGIWTGERCESFYASGCALVGPDCEGIYPSLDACMKARAACMPGSSQPTLAGSAASSVTAAGSGGQTIANTPTAPPTEDQAACAKGDGKACLRLGEQTSQQQNPDWKYRYYVAACNAHVGLACVQLGQSLEPDPNQRAGWLKRALVEFESGCTIGDAESCYYLGIALERGTGVPLDATRAQQIYAKGCELGSLYACTNEAGLHLQGKGVKKDTARAATLYARACDRRDDRACYWLGAIHEQELALLSDHSNVGTLLRSEKLGTELRVKDSRIPVRPSPARRGPATALLLERDPRQLAANCDQGQSLACYELGVATQVGGGRFHKDDRQAVGYYEKACSLGSGWGCLRAGDCYERAYGVRVDLSKASKYFLDVCERGVGGTEGFEQQCANLGERIDAQ
jgi:TPR repeat protein